MIAVLWKRRADRLSTTELYRSDGITRVYTQPECLTIPYLSITVGRYGQSKILLFFFFPIYFRIGWFNFIVEGLDSIESIELRSISSSSVGHLLLSLCPRENTTLSRQSVRKWYIQDKWTLFCFVCLENCKELYALPFLVLNSSFRNHSSSRNIDIQLFWEC